MAAERAKQVEGEPQPFLVVGAIIRREGEVLIAQRRPDDQTAPLMWEFPGGKVDTERGETPEAALIREMWEEMKMAVSPIRPFGENVHTYDLPDGPRKIHLQCFECRSKSDSYELIHVHDARWAQIASLLPEEFAPADVPIVEKLIGENS